MGADVENPKHETTVENPNHDRIAMLIVVPSQPRKRKNHVKPPTDAPTPPPPVEPANVIWTGLDGSQLVVTFEFDKEITLIGGPPFAMDDAIQVNDTNPIDAYQPTPAMIALVFENTVSPGAAWNINRTPAWCATPLAVSGGTVG
jgi:hypothetical protein